jgi:hypothetical protein
MLAVHPAAGVTFAVHDVEPARKPLPTCKTHEAIALLASDRVESCCDYTAACVAQVRAHPLISAVHLAFSEHRPLVLSPDMIWITILQGLAQHVANHAEQLRPRRVRHQGKLTVEVRRPDFVAGSPENPWPEVFSAFSDTIRPHISADLHAALTADFSTTGPVEKAVSDVVLLDVFQPYFAFALYCVCGIPAVTLEGTVEDWRRLRIKVETLARFDLEWWLQHLRPICDQFEWAAAGEPDRWHWQNIYKLHDAYGGKEINGWMAKLFPYLKNHHTGQYTERNPMLEDEQARLFFSTWSNSFPSGLSQVPFTWHGPKDTRRAMQFLAGHVGITQDEQTLALRPKLGWAVRLLPRLDQLLLEASRHEMTPALPARELEEKIIRAGRQRPDDLHRFYRACNGLRLFGGAYRFRPLEEVAPGLPVMRHLDHVFPGHDLSALCDFADGSVAVTDFAWEREDPTRYPVLLYEGQQGLCELPIIANSLTDLLERALASGGELFHRRADFAPEGRVTVGPPKKWNR